VLQCVLQCVLQYGRVLVHVPYISYVMSVCVCVYQYVCDAPLCTAHIVCLIAVPMCCSMLQYVAVCCSVMQCA